MARNSFQGPRNLKEEVSFFGDPLKFSMETAIESRPIFGPNLRFAFKSKHDYILVKRRTHREREREGFLSLQGSELARSKV